VGKAQHQIDTGICISISGLIRMFFLPIPASPRRYGSEGPCIQKYIENKQNVINEQLKLI
jgi:hypothetical protein